MKGTKGKLGKKQNIEPKEVSKNEKGITLIALVITIIILIILATVTITLVFGEGGLIKRAQEGKNLTDQAQKDEQDELKGAEEFINGIIEGEGTTNPPEEKSEVEEARDNGEPFPDTTTITDDLDNPVTVPGGFNIAEDSGTKVEEGIVIEDSNDNQFVWIPVGEYKVSTSINSTGKLTNELSRRTFSNSGAILVEGDSVISSYYYGEGNENSVAKEQIAYFQTSATSNKGFYIGRYEQGEGNVCKAGVNPYANITRDNAKIQAETMYSGNDYVTSQLISSYAWDTALNFICQTNEEGYLLSTTTDKNYGNIGTYNITKTGEYEIDNYSKIHDFLGNCFEWTTEYSNNTLNNKNYSCTGRGGYYFNSSYYSAYRSSYGTEYMGYDSFRIQLYINPTN